MTDRCSMTDLPRSSCAHCTGRTGGVVTAKALEALLARPVPEYRYRVRPVGGYRGAGRWYGVRGERGAITVELVYCQHPRGARPLCSVCEDRFWEAVANVPALVEDLELALRKQTRFAGSGSSVEADGLLWSTQASAALERLRDELAYPGVAERRVWSSQQAAAWMLANWSEVMAAEDVAVMAESITGTVVRALLTIDRPRDRMYLGDCPQSDCPAELWPERGARQVKCELCGWEGVTRELIDAWVARGDEEYLPDRDLLLALPGLTLTLLERWVRRDGIPREERVRPRWRDGRLEASAPVWVYRLGSVRERLVRHERERAMADSGVPVVSTSEVGERLGVSAAAVWKLVERGQLVPVRKGTRPLWFAVAEVDRLAAKRDAGADMKADAT